MVNFRYHLVSLTAVFLALAVGIALGAGPLRDSISMSLSGEAAELRTLNAKLQGQLAGQAAADEWNATVLDQLAEDLTQQSLTGQQITIISQHPVDSAEVDQVIQALSGAGGEVVSAVTLAERWFDPGQHSFRSALGSSLLTHLSTDPANTTSTDVLLATALAESLTVGDAAGGAGLAQEAGIISALLSDGELTVLDQAPTGAAGVVVAILSGASLNENTTVSGALSVQLEAISAVAPTIAVALDDAGREEVLQIRASAQVTGTVSTLTNGSSAAGLLALPLAISQHLQGEIAHYGVENDATSAFPPVRLVRQQ